VQTDTTRAFLSRWVRDDGKTIVAVATGRKADGHRYFRHFGFPSGDADGPRMMALGEDAKGNDVYLALARFGDEADDKGRPRRVAGNAVGCASFQADLDVKEGGYASLREAVGALAGACDTLSLPPPNVGVRSGRGLHVYWRLRSVLAAGRWQSLAELLTAALLGAGLRFDVAITKDIARILRVPGTRNWKDPGHPLPVSVAWWKDVDHDVGTFEAALARRATSHQGAPLVPAILPGLGGGPGGAAGLAGATPSPTAQAQAEPDELGGGRAPPPADLGNAVRECGIMGEAMQTGGKGYAEPLWRSLLLLCTFGDEPTDDTAHAMSCLHQDYSKADTDAKLTLIRTQYGQARAKGQPFGPPSCSVLDQLYRGQFGTNPHCAACAHRGHIKTPAYAPMRQNVQAASQIGWAGAAARQPPSERVGNYWPDFVLGGMRTVFMTPKGVEEKRLVTEYHVRGPHLARDERGAEDVVAYWSLKDWPARQQGELGRRVAIPVAHINDPKLFARSLGENGLALPDHHRQETRTMYAAFTTQLRQYAVTRELPKSLGWHEAGGVRGFVIGGRYWRADGSDIETSPGTNPFASVYDPKGSLDEWMRAATFILTDLRPHLHAYLAGSLGSILLPMLNVHGAALSMWSRASGRGKTTMASLAASVWGDTVLSLASHNDTTNSIITRAQFTGCLPTPYDDARKDWDEMGQFLFRYVSGKEKMRLTAGAQLQMAGGFDGLLMMTSNFPLVEMIGKGYLDRASQARILEGEVPPFHTVLPTSDADAAEKALANNYGHFGVRFARHALANYERLKGQVGTFLDKLTSLSAISPSDREARFQVATASVMLVAAIEARGLGLTLDPGIINTFLLTRLKELKALRAMAASTPQGVQLLTEFLDAYADNRFVVNGTTVEDRPRRSPLAYVVMRHQHGLRVSRTVISDWLIQRRIPPQPVLTEMLGFFGGHERTMSMTRDVLGAVGARQQVVLLPLRRQPLDTFL
jgi:hypothetical protein